MTDQLREALKWLDHQPHAEALTAARELRKWLAVKESEPIPVSSVNVSGVEMRVVRVPDDMTGPLRLVAVSDD